MLGGPAPYQAGVTLAGMLAAVCGMAVMSSAHAGDWRLTTGVSVEESFSDNASLATGDAERNSEFITQISPNISVRGQGGRMSLGLNYTPSQLLHRQDSTKDQVNHNLAATGQIEVWDRVAFVEAQASVSRQIINNEEASSTSLAGQNVNRTETRAINITPIFRHHFGTWVETESRLTFSKVDTAEDELESTRTITENLRINSGRRFTVLQWSTNIRSEKVQNDGDSPTQRTQTVDGNLTYIVSPKLSLLASLGYEKVEDSTLNSEPKGLTWNAGFQARPSGKTDFRFTYGIDNDTQTIDFSANHRLSERTSLSASFSESLETSQGEISDDLSFVIVDPVSNGLIDSRTGNPFTGSNNNLGLQDETFRQEEFRVSLNGSRRLVTFGASAFWERRKTESTSITESTVGADLSLGRTINTRTSGNVALNYKSTDFGTVDERTQKEITFSTGLRYSLAPDVSVNFSYILTHRRVNNANEDLTENAVTVGLSKRF